jgi:hypothetical protein
MVFMARYAYQNCSATSQTPIPLYEILLGKLMPKKGWSNEVLKDLFDSNHVTLHCMPTVGELDKVAKQNGCLTQGKEVKK